jgi:hypothetical protein
MPSAGYRNGLSSAFNDVGSSYGNYWSSTALNSDYAFLLNFPSAYTDPIPNPLCQWGLSVRCIKSF